MERTKTVLPLVLLTVPSKDTWIQMMVSSQDVKEGTKITSHLHYIILTLMCTFEKM